MKKIIGLTVGVTLLAVLFPPPAAAQIGLIKQALQGIAAVFDQLAHVPRTDKNKLRHSDELRLSRTAFKTILTLAAAENNDLKNKLIAFKNLDEELTVRRDQYLNELGNHSSYHESLTAAADRDLTLPRLKELANQFREWRRAVYQPAVEKIISFILLADGGEVLRRAQNRLVNIRADLDKIDDFPRLKESPLSTMLDTAETTLTEAGKLYQAARIIILQTENGDIQKLIEKMVVEIQKAYATFTAMGQWLLQATKK